MRNCRCITVLSMVLHSHEPNAYKFLQTSVGIEMWRQGASQKLFRTMNFIGLSMSAAMSRTQVDRLIINHDAVILAQKKLIEVYL